MTQVESKQYWPVPNIDLILEKAGQLWAALSGSCTWFKLPFDQTSSLPVLFVSQKSEICPSWGKVNCATLLLFPVLCPELFPIYLLLQQLPDNKCVAYSDFFVQVKKNALLKWVSLTDAIQGASPTDMTSVLSCEVSFLLSSARSGGVQAWCSRIAGQVTTKTWPQRLSVESAAHLETWEGFLLSSASTREPGILSLVLSRMNGYGFSITCAVAIVFSTCL